MKAITKESVVLDRIYCPNCDGTTEESEITNYEEIEDWGCLNCEERYCWNCYHPNVCDGCSEDFCDNCPKLKTFIDQNLCEDCYDGEVQSE